MLCKKSLSAEGLLPHLSKYFNRRFRNYNRSLLIIVKLAAGMGIHTRVGIPRNSYRNARCFLVRNQRLTSKSIVFGVPGGIISSWFKPQWGRFPFASNTGGRAPSFEYWVWNLFTFLCVYQEVGGKLDCLQNHCPELTYTRGLIEKLTVPGRVGWYYYKY